MNLLEARGVSKSFGGVRAVQDVSLGVPEKSIFALIGPNGAGKSTLLNLLSGIYQPDAGSLFLEDKKLTGLPAHRRVRLGIARTFQKIRLFKQLTLLENVLAGFHIHHDTPFWKYVVHGDTGRFRAEASAWARAPASAPARCPTASSACSRSRARSPRGRAFSCSTSRPQG